MIISYSESRTEKEERRLKEDVEEPDKTDWIELAALNDCNMN